ncbi:putative ribosomal protein L26/L24, KOW [Helianthus annuus]|nr:putative ribosomal protein L26/L24, KOW [Helianthus annuus]KAJ0941670.1 putative ribosomal protein L26/L24, KOW [Helianthus annuus]
MGWKAAQKLIHLIHHWKILRGDNVKKHIKQGQGHQVGIFTVEAPLHVSNV